MNDLLDLDFTSSSTSTSTSVKSTIPKLKGNPNYGGISTFDNLASSSNYNNNNSINRINNNPSPNNSSRSHSPFLSSTSTITTTTNTINGLNSIVNSRSNSLLSPPSSSTSNTNSKLPNNNNTINSNNDAFASLFGDNSTFTSSNSRQLSSTPRNLSNSSTAFRTSTIAPPPPPPPLPSSTFSSSSSNTNSNKELDPWDFDLLSSSKSTLILTSTSSILKPSNHNNNNNNNDDEEVDDGLGDFLPPTFSKNGSSISTSTSNLNPNPNPNLNTRRDSFDYTGIFSSPPPVPTPTPAAPTPSSLSFSSSSPPRPTSSLSSTSKSITRKFPDSSPSSSPPPHILGQLIEMGFSILDSTNALKSSRISETGEWNVEGAVSILSSSSSSSSSSFSSSIPHQEEESVLPLPRTGRRAREVASSLASSNTSSRSITPIPGSGSGSGLNLNLVNQIQSTTELFSHASKLGLSVFKSASGYYSTGKEIVKKVLVEERIVGVEESGGGGGGGGVGGGGKGRPKWMSEDSERFGDEEVVKERQNMERKREESSNGTRGEGRSKTLLFQDSDEEGIDISPSFSNQSKKLDSVLPQRPIISKSNSNGSGGIGTGRKEELIRPNTPSLSSTSTSSTSRPQQQQQQQTSQSKSSPIPRKPTPPSRILVTATPSQLSLSLSHKEKGNQHYKLGLFSESIVSYSLAIESLPPRHFNLLNLFNNRGMARLKIGDESGCIEDCQVIIEIILRSDLEEGKKLDWLELEREDNQNSSPARGGGGGGGGGGDLPNFREQLAKAIFKRAKAFETKEKWSKALEDYKLLLEGGEIVMKAVGGIKIVADGSVRCRKMVEGSDSSTFRKVAPSVVVKKPLPSRSTPSTTTTTTSTTSTSNQSSGQAVQALRTANATALAEEDLRLSLKDSVDHKINLWKNGKETNLRGLIASLDNVLWTELNWKKVGMHELITEGQVKVRYVRAIGKVHPDKLNVNNTTVEQRMIAGGVFSALNDAFKSSR